MARESGVGESETHGRYYAEYVRDVSDQPQGQLQTLLDEKDAREWHLVGRMPESGIWLAL